MAALLVLALHLRFQPGVRQPICEKAPQHDSRRPSLLTAATREVVMTVLTSTGTVTVNAAFLEEIKEVNQELWQLLGDLRHRCQRPVAPGHCRLLIDKLCQLRDQLALHFALEEAYGYFENPVEVAPQLSRAAGRLLEEHKTLYLDFCDIAE